MNLERVVERLRDYRLKNERFDQLVGVVLSNEKAMRAARHSRSGSFRLPQGADRRCGDYDSVFFIAGEMRSGTSWLRHSLSDHPEIACGQEELLRTWLRPRGDSRLHRASLEPHSRPCSLQGLEDLARTAVEPVVGRLRRRLEESLATLGRLLPLQRGGPHGAQDRGGQEPPAHRERGRDTRDLPRRQDNPHRQGR